MRGVLSIELPEPVYWVRISIRLTLKPVENGSTPVIFDALFSAIRVILTANVLYGCFVHTELSLKGNVVVYVPGVPLVAFVA
jgi:hypothetical protein